MHVHITHTHPRKHIRHCACQIRADAVAHEHARARRMLPIPTHGWVYVVLLFFLLNICVYHSAEDRQTKGVFVSAGHALF
jgi:hypothetical protein